jgi:preprotein translocase subunit SecB
MTDSLAGATQGEEINPAGIRVLAQYTRDLSFENPRAPDSLRVSGEQPAIDIGVELNAKGRPDGLFEVELKLTVDAKKGGEQSFAVELVYGGLFELAGIPPEELEPVLMIEAPRFLFPFARRIIGDLTSDGGFPPFMLEPIDFAGIYQSRRAQGEGQGVVVGQA